MDLGRKEDPENPSKGKPAKKALANLDSLRKIFTVPVGEDSTLIQMEQEISSNLMGFLRQHIVAGEITPKALEQDFLDTSIPTDPIFVSEQAHFLLDKVVAQSVHTSSPSFIGHMTSAIPYFMFPLAKIMMALNQNLDKIETSKAFTPLERQVVGMLHRLVYEREEAFYQKNTQDYDTALGVFGSGGTVANMTALWVARNRLLPPKDDFCGIAEDGLAQGLLAHGLAGACILVSARGHYSIGKAADLLGIGRRHVIAVPTKPDYTIDLKALKELGQKAQKSGLGILSLVGVAGTTETGSVDPLEPMAEIAKELGCHFHVDAAWGAPTLFSRTHQHLLKGIELADSVTVDAHKQLLVPLSAGICLFRDPDSVKAIEHNAKYIIRKGSRDLGKHTLEGSRAGMAMLVHSALKIIGRRGYEILVDLGIGKAELFAEMIDEAETFELISSPQLNLLTYRFLPTVAQELLQDDDPEVRTRTHDLLSRLTSLIQKRQRANGKTFVSRTTLECQHYEGHPLTVFRVVTANPLTTKQILRDILVEQRSYGDAIMTEQKMHENFTALKNLKKT